MPACPRRATTSTWCCGCRTATPCRSRRERWRWTAWARSTRWRWTARSAPFATLALDVAEAAARPALAGADRAARRPPRGAPALRGDPRRPHPHRPRQRGARRSASRPGHPRAAARPGPRLSAAFPDPAPRPLPQHRSADADGGDPGRPAGAAGRVRHRGAQGGGTLPGLPAARPRAGGGLRRTFRSTAATPNWSTISATAAAPTAGCTRCSATRTASPATPRNPASARTSSIP